MAFLINAVGITMVNTLRHRSDIKQKRKTSSVPTIGQVYRFSIEQGHIFMPLPPNGALR